MTTFSIPHIEGAPVHLVENHDRRWRLIRWANMLAGHYGEPVYLCGSALRDDNPEPRDWDIRITLADEDFSLRYGDVQQWEDEGASGMWTTCRWRWSDECVKKHRQGIKHTDLNIDFQIYPASHVAKRYSDEPRLRLDTRP